MNSVRHDGYGYGYDVDEEDYEEYSGYESEYEEEEEEDRLEEKSRRRGRGRGRGRGRMGERRGLVEDIEKAIEKELARHAREMGRLYGELVRVARDREGGGERRKVVEGRKMMMKKKKSRRRRVLGDIVGGGNDREREGGEMLMMMSPSIAFPHLNAVLNAKTGRDRSGQENEGVGVEGRLTGSTAAKLAAVRRALSEEREVEVEELVGCDGEVGVERKVERKVEREREREREREVEREDRRRRWRERMMLLDSLHGKEVWKTVFPPPFDRDAVQAEHGKHGVVSEYRAWRMQATALIKLMRNAGDPCE